ncbi:ABC transporter family substrate-binding protein [Propionibacteriaceae bacterium Y2011]|uniref:ABC transporter family substrate-binding protein n=1 Tax=Microlunatus sp. Y2014 TaxID=3418488 RepID=UPI003B46C842
MARWGIPPAPAGPRLPAAVVVVLTLTVLLAGCLSVATPRLTTTGTTPTAPQHSDIAPTDPRMMAVGGELRIAVDGPSPQWNPWHVEADTEAMEQVLGPITPKFFTYDDEGRPHANPAYLAKEPTASGDPLVVTLQLNPEAVWADGEPITWRDVAAPLRTCNGNQPEFACADTTGPATVAKVARGADDFEAVITFTGPQPAWRDVLAAPGRADLFATPEAFSLTRPDPRAQAGPFVVQAYDAGRRIVAESVNPHWWGPAPALERISFRWLDPAAQPGAFVNNEVDVFHVGLNRDGLVRAQAVPDGEVRQARGDELRTLLVNTDAGPLTDPAVRRAIATTIDREAFREAASAGLESGTVWPTVAAGNRLLGAEQAGHRDTGAELGLPDPVRAAAELDAAGYRLQGDGTRAKAGEPLTVTFTRVAGLPESTAEGLMVQAQLSQLGIAVTFVDVPAERLGPLLADGQYQLAIADRASLTEPGQLFTSGAAGNVEDVADDQLDALLAELARQTSAGGRARVANDADERLWELGVSIPLHRVPQRVAVKKRIANYGAFGQASRDWTRVGYRT